MERLNKTQRRALWLLQKYGECGCTAPTATVIRRIVPIPLYTDEVDGKFIIYLTDTSDRAALKKEVLAILREDKARAAAGGEGEEKVELKGLRRQIVPIALPKEWEEWG